MGGRKAPTPTPPGVKRPPAPSAPPPKNPGKIGSVPARKSTKSKAPAVPRAKAPKATGRLPVEVDAKVLEALAFAGSPDVEIADYLGISVDTLTRRFADILRKTRASRKVRLRRAQWTTALGTAKVPGNPTMQIWLGKVELKQKEPIAVPTDENGNPVVMPSSIDVRLVDPKFDDDDDDETD